MKKIKRECLCLFPWSYSGGTNPSLIEALGSTDLNLLIDVGFNREVAEGSAIYWNRNNGNLANLIDEVDKMTISKIKEIR